jgi:hypothetical protein
MLNHITIINQTTSPWTILGPLLGAFTGVFIGFLINEAKRRSLVCHRQLFFKNLLLTEIEKSIEIFVEDKYELIPIDGWNSLLNSGDIAFFKDNATKLSETYSEIQWYNNELKILRESIERESISFNFKSNYDSEESGDPKKRRSEILRDYTRDRKGKLLKKLFDVKKLLKEMEVEEWWQLWK